MRNLAHWFEGITVTRNVAHRFKGITRHVTHRFEGITRHVAHRFKGITWHVAHRFEGVTRHWDSIVPLEVALPRETFYILKP